MANCVPDWIICGIIIGTCVLIHLCSDVLRISLNGLSDEGSISTLSQIVESHSKDYGWILKLIVNCFGYSCVFIPAYLIYKYVKKTNYLERSDKSLIHSAVSLCMVGSTGSDTERIDSSLPQAQQTSSKKSASQDAILLVYCFIGLMGSYLTWGVLQEKIMTQEYINFNGKRENFKDSQFLVFTNRFLAFTISGTYLLIKSVGRHRAPLYKYSFSSFSNIMSAWFQYEALKFVNFPTQVLAKSCKIIPVMLMGRILSKNKYEPYEYLTAGLISLGMVFFMFGSADNSKASSVTTFTGIFLLSMYMLFDSFTANWQSDLFKSYGMASIQMMCGTNLFSTIFTASSLSVQGGFVDSLSFATEHPKFIFDCIILSISSVIGQLFIFYTISVFGPVVFTIIMTLRQAAAIMLSCFIYNHSISFLGVIGIIVVFIAVFLRVYCNQRLKAIRKRAEALRPKMAV